jgi:hypothetical protein
VDEEKRRDVTALPLLNEAATSSLVLKKRINQELLILQDDSTIMRNKYIKNLSEPASYEIREASAQNGTIFTDFRSLSIAHIT